MRLFVAKSSDQHAMLWRKNSCSLTNGDCVEVAGTSNLIVVRDSKDPDGPMLSYARAEWDAFVADVMEGEFDGNEAILPEVSQ